MPFDAVREKVCWTSNNGSHPPSSLNHGSETVFSSLSGTTHPPLQLGAHHRLRNRWWFPIIVPNDGHHSLPPDDDGSQTAFPFPSESHPALH